MPRRKATRGNCIYCGKDYTRWGMTSHLGKCTERASAIEFYDAGAEQLQKIVHLLVEDLWSTDYWLHLEIAGNATLDQLDQYLRVTWLECCGHLSHFLINGTFYDREIDIERAVEESESMFTQIAEAFRQGTVAGHEYGFWATTHLRITPLAVRSGNWVGKPIRMLARNNTPTMKCMVCHKQADWICAECLSEDRNCFLCGQHVEQHSHEDAMVLPAVNSPRIGMCDYYGPAEPPY